MPKRKPVEAAEPAPVVAEPKKKAVKTTTAAQLKSTAGKAAHKHHAKNTDSVVDNVIAATPAVNVTPDVIARDVTREAIARLAYSYWEARGRQGGSPELDWLQAEGELLKLTQHR